MKYQTLVHPHDHKKISDWRVILKFIDKNFKNINLRKTLELGAGMGNISYYFASQGISAVAEDINMEYLNIIQNRNPSISVLRHDINDRLPFTDKSFDFVSCVGTMHYHYAKDVRSIIKEMIRVSNKYILIDFLSKYSTYRLLETLYYRRYNPRCVSKKDADFMLKELNLKVIGATSTKSLPIIRDFFPFAGKTVYLILEKLK